MHVLSGCLLEDDASRGGGPNRLHSYLSCGTFFLNRIPELEPGKLAEHSTSLLALCILMVFRDMYVTCLMHSMQLSVQLDDGEVDGLESRTRWTD